MDEKYKAFSQDARVALSAGYNASCASTKSEQGYWHHVHADRGASVAIIRQEFINTAQR